MRVHWLQHVPFEGLGRIGDWFIERGVRPVGHRLFAGDPLPDPGAVDALVVMGGPMSVNDGNRLPWLDDERRFVAETLEAGRPVLGVCLGAQMIAAALGAPVYPAARREIGWFPIRREGGSGTFGFTDGLPVFHWHGETFDLPPGAALLASSAACGHQAFQWGERVIGTQFHLETTPETARALVEHCADELEPPDAFVQTAERILEEAPGACPRVHRELDRLLGYLFQL